MMTTIRLSMCIIALPLDAHSSIHQPWPHISVVFQQNTCPRIMSNYTRLLHRHQIHYFPYLLLLSNAVVVPERSLIFQKVKWHCHQNTYCINSMHVQIIYKFFVKFIFHSFWFRGENHLIISSVTDIHRKAGRHKRKRSSDCFLFKNVKKDITNVSRW